MKKKIIEISEVSKKFGDNKVIDSFSLDVFEGECLSVMGESGSGKSTLAKLIMGMENIDSGEIKILNISRTTKNTEEKRILASSLELLFQNSYQALNPKLTVEELIFEPLSFSESIFKRKKIVKELLVQVELDENLIHRKIFELSGGQIQRVCLARMLATHPKIIIFDESLSGLDPLIQDKILELLVGIQKKYNLTYIFISHDFELCYYLSDRIILVEKGKIVEEFKNFERKFEVKTEKAKNLLSEAIKEMRENNLF